MLTSRSAGKGALENAREIDHIVKSWAFAVYDQILDETKSAFLSQATPAHAQFSSLLKEKSSASPVRRTSLAHSFDQAGDAQSLFENLKSRIASGEGTPKKRTGLDYLASRRTGLLLLQRQILQEIGNEVGFITGLKHNSSTGVMKDVSLEDDSSVDSEQNSPSAPASVSGQDPPLLWGINHQQLLDALSSLRQTRSLYEEITKDALDHYFTAGQSKGFERMLADIAVLKFQSGDYATAANYFGKVIPLYAQLQWSLVETEMLFMHAESLKRLNRRDDYVRLLLSLLSEAVARKTTSGFKYPLWDIEYPDLEWHRIDDRSLSDELFSASTQLPYDITVKLPSYFTNIAVEPYIHHFEDREGFRTQLKLRHVLNDEIVLDRVSVLLQSTGTSAGREIWLHNEGPVTLFKGGASIPLVTSVSPSILFNYTF
jgi:hypothetical protein